MQQYKNNLTQNQCSMDLRPSSDALFKISVPFFAQIEIPSYSLQILMGRFPSDELKLPRLFVLFETEDWD